MKYELIKWHPVEDEKDLPKGMGEYLLELDNGRIVIDRVVGGENDDSDSTREFERFYASQIEAWAYMPDGINHESERNTVHFSIDRAEDVITIFDDTFFSLLAEKGLQIDEKRKEMLKEIMTLRGELSVALRMMKENKK